MEASNSPGWMCDEPATYRAAGRRPVSCWFRKRRLQKPIVPQAPGLFLLFTLNQYISVLPCRFILHRYHSWQRYSERNPTFALIINIFALSIIAFEFYRVKMSIGEITVCRMLLVRSIDGRWNPSPSAVFSGG